MWSVVWLSATGSIGFIAVPSDVRLELVDSCVSDFSVLSNVVDDVADGEFVLNGVVGFVVDDLIVVCNVIFVDDMVSNIGGMIVVCCVVVVGGGVVVVVGGDGRGIDVDWTFIVDDSLVLVDNTTAVVV